MMVVYGWRAFDRRGRSAYAANEAAIRFYRRHGFTPLSVELAADAEPLAQ
jgi:ribosomal protein S18 acetylase RimI-like enzyme